VLTTATVDTIHRAQLAQAADNLRIAAAAFDTMRQERDINHADIAAYTRTIRADLDALNELGYTD
jgi:hypothetical protein